MGKFKISWKKKKFLEIKKIATGRIYPVGVKKTRQKKAGHLL